MRTSATPVDLGLVAAGSRAAASTAGVDATPERWRVAIAALGGGGAALLPLLGSVTGAPLRQLAAALYRAPSILAENLSRAQAEQMSDLLRAAGLETAVLGEDEPFEQGTDEHEVAIVVDDVAKMTAVLEQVMSVLGVDLPTARRLACAMPAVLLANVSLATVEALRRRFQPLGVELEACRPALGRFDIYVGRCNELARQSVLRVAEQAGIAVSSRTGPAAGGYALLAEKVEWRRADAFWEGARRCPAPVRVLNRAYQRFDVCLEAAPAEPPMLDFVASLIGASAPVAARLVAQLPVFIRRNLRHAEAHALLERIAALGGRASASLVGLEDYDVALGRTGDPAAVVRALQYAGGLSADAAQRAARARPSWSGGPYTNVQARWLRAELQRVGTEARILRR